MVRTFRWLNSRRFVRADAARLGVALVERSRKEVKHTPFDPDFSCAACPVVDLIR